jgi:hypothetical protein
MKPGTVVHTCNPSYLGGRDQEDGDPRQKVHEIASQPMAGYRGTHLYPATWESTSRSLEVEASLGIK